MEMKNRFIFSSYPLLVDISKPFYDNGKPLETVGRKAIGPFKRMAAELPKKELVCEGNKLNW